MKAKTKARYVSAMWRAIRTFGAAFVGYLALNVVGLWDVSTWKGALGAGAAALFTLILRWLDFTPVPTPPSG